MPLPVPLPFPHVHATPFAWEGGCMRARRRRRLPSPPSPLAAATFMESTREHAALSLSPLLPPPSWLHHLVRAEGGRTRAHRPSHRRATPFACEGGGHAAPRPLTLPPCPRHPFRTGRGTQGRPSVPVSPCVAQQGPRPPRAHIYPRPPIFARLGKK
ncbi:hypothetical protein EDB86DRAFT_244380 [Lactarius hatsudake]|nr:hypothetical protein EDB86DRAFT_244380 [Lactarius hatsudake]